MAGSRRSRCQFAAGRIETGDGPVIANVAYPELRPVFVTLRELASVLPPTVAVFPVLIPEWQRPVLARWKGRMLMYFVLTLHDFLEKVSDLLVE